MPSSACSAGRGALPHTAGTRLFSTVPGGGLQDGGNRAALAPGPHSTLARACWPCTSLEEDNRMAARGAPRGVLRGLQRRLRLRPRQCWGASRHPQPGEAGRGGAVWAWDRGPGGPFSGWADVGRRAGGVSHMVPLLPGGVLGVGGLPQGLWHPAPASGPGGLPASLLAAGHGQRCPARSTGSGERMPL